MQKIVVDVDTQTVVPMSRFMQKVLDAKLALEEQVASLEQQLQQRCEDSEKLLGIASLLGLYPDASYGDMRGTILHLHDKVAKLTTDKAHLDIENTRLKAQVKDLEKTLRHRDENDMLVRKELYRQIDGLKKK